MRRVDKERLLIFIALILFWSLLLGRTLPRVRELKRVVNSSDAHDFGRTLPRVRELKHVRYVDRAELPASHPSQGA